MSTTYTRDELLDALRVVTQFLQSLPPSLSFASDLPATSAPRVATVSPGTSPSVVAPVPAPAAPRAGRDGSQVGPHPLRDGRPVLLKADRHAPQPPRKIYTPAKRVARGTVEQLPRAARRISEYLTLEARPLTSHEIMQTLEMARPTFDNAISLLLKAGAIVAEPVR